MRKKIPIIHNIQYTLYNLGLFLNHKSIYYLYLPKKYCRGINQDFRRPHLRMNKESTNGAHKSFILNGHTAKLNLAYIIFYNMIIINSIVVYLIKY